MAAMPLQMTKHLWCGDNILIGELQRLPALEFAVICAILAKAGPQRSRQLATLYKDERSSKLDIYSILEKMYVV